ncbi:MAG: transposase [Nanoarchaeota archaeon]
MTGNDSMQVQTTFKRDWSNYNASQTSEKLIVMKIINDAVESMNIEYKYAGNGRPSIGTEDMLKVCLLKVFNGFSQRRTIPDLHMAKALGYIMDVPHFNSISNYFDKEELTPYLEDLYKILALPFREIESYFAIDSTGFGKYNTTWLRVKKDRKQWKSFNKLHIICGVQTTIISSVKITDAHQHDVLKFSELLKDTCKYFNVKEISGDKGYLANYNVMQAKRLGVTPYILPKKNSKLYSGRIGDGETWDWMINLWRHHEEEFRSHYHKRSNVESTFSSMKRKFLPYVRSKKQTSQKNEILAKVCCHNASVLVNAIFELNLQAKFQKQAS